MIHSAITNIAPLCAQLGIGGAVLSPGSRSAPLTLAFANYAGVPALVVPDERVAGFVALGRALQSGQPQVLVCTSGSAGLNYAPAVAEAFFARVPLIVFTADRPPELIDRQDGQTIYQQNMFGPHAKASYNLTPNYKNLETQAHLYRTINRAVALATTPPYGPVHINLPFREPFYPDGPLVYGTPPVVNIKKTATQRLPTLPQLGRKTLKTMVVAGQQFCRLTAHRIIDWATENQAVVLTEPLSNLPNATNTMRLFDAYVGTHKQPNLNPDLLITVGGAVVSKALKTWLRQNKPTHHWHICPTGTAPDTFGTLTDIVACQPQSFFNNKVALPNTNDTYLQAFNQLEAKAKRQLMQCLNEMPYGELPAVHAVLKALPLNTQLHLANSMPVRWPALLGWAPAFGQTVFANRGTSGIDGCTSTAIGAAQVANKPVTLITGDTAFLYDSNAFWQEKIPENIFIVIINNQGGGIFGLINGPANRPERNRFFEARHNHNAQHLCHMYGLTYLPVHNLTELDNALAKFWQQGPAVLELLTDPQTNQTLWNSFKQNVFF